MADKMNDLPKAYTLYEVKNDLHHFTNIEEDSKTGEILSKNIYTRNMEGQLVLTCTDFVQLNSNSNL